MQNHRKQKVVSQLRKILSELINRDYSEKYGFITVIEVVVSDDFNFAKVYLSFFSSNEKMKTKMLHCLNEKAISYQRYLGRKLKIRLTPKLSFVITDSLKDLNRITNLLENNKNVS